ncbi:MAG: sodium:solute symporter family protein [Planctomycetales bacterium]
MNNAPLEWLGVSLIDWIVIILYLISVTVLGVWSMFKVKNLSDYFMGGRRFGKVFMMFFAFGSGTSSEQAISVVAGTWRVGLAGIWWQFLWLWATPFYWIVAPVMRRMRALTTSDFFDARFDASTATLYSLFGVIMSIVFIAGGLYGSGKMVDALTGGELEIQARGWNIQVPSVEWDGQAKTVKTGWRQMQGYEFAILAMTVMFVLYGMAGGLGAAIITDFIQGILTVTFSFLLLPFVFGQIGGFSELHAQGDVKRGMFDLVSDPEQAAMIAKTLGKEPITAFYVLMLSLTALAGIVAQPHIMGVCGAGKTEFEGRFGFTFGNFMKRLCTLAWTFTGLACIVWYLGTAGNNHPLPPGERALYDFDRVTLEDLNQNHVTAEELDKFDGDGDGEISQDERNKADREFADRLFGRAAYDILPQVCPGLIGLLMASLLAAVMSTSDAQMIVSSGLFTENIYRRFLVRNASQTHYVWVGRLSGLVIVMLALLLQATFTDVIDALKKIINVPAAMGISLWFGIAWRGWTPAAVWVSALATMAVWAHTGFFPEHYNNPALGFMLSNATPGQETMSHAWQMFAFLSAGVGSGLIASMLTRRTDAKKMDKFFLLLRTPVTLDEEVSEPCTLPKDPAKPLPKLINHPDIELPKPTSLDVGGFLFAWLLVGLIIALTYWLAS